MNEPTIDNLFSIVAPRPDVSQSVASRRNDDPGGFDDQLRQAGYSEPVLPPAPQWRPPAQRNDVNQRRTDANGPSLPPHQPAPKPATDRSSSADRSSAASHSPVVNKAGKKDDRNKRDSDQSTATSASSANTAQAANKPASGTSGSDKPGTGKDRASEVAREAKDSKDQADQAKLADSTVTEPAATAKGDGAAASTQEIAVPQADVLSATDDQAKTTPPTDDKTDSLKAAIAAKLNDPAATTSTTITTTAAVTDEQTATSTNKPTPDTKSQADKAATDRGLSTEIAPSQSTAQIEQLAAKQPVASAGANPADASTQSTAASASTPAVKSDGKEENQTAKADASSAALANPTDAVRVNANQPSPNVAAIAAPTTAAASPIDGSAGADAKSAKSSATLKSTSLSAFGRFDRDGLLTSSGPRQAGESQDAPTVDPARFVGRVARAIETAQERGGPINLRLSPPELGSMRIELSLKDGVMNAKVETETASARQALLDNLPALRDKLANQNVRIERFEVDVRRDAQGDQSNRGPQQRQFQQQQQQHYQSRSARPATAATGGIEGLATEPTSAVRTITDTTINLVA